MGVFTSPAWELMGFCSGWRLILEAGPAPELRLPGPTWPEGPQKSQGPHSLHVSAPAAPRAFQAGH